MTGAMPFHSAAGTTPRTDDEGDSKSGFAWFLVKVVIAVFLLRVVVFSVFSIPSESMMPTLLRGDYLMLAKWPYGISKYSLPFDTLLPEGTLFSQLPEQGDVVVFKHPIDGSDYIKRVIGLSGDRVAMRAGQLFLNGKPVERERIDDLALGHTPYVSCRGAETVAPASGGKAETCAYVRYRERLPNGTTYMTLDFGRSLQDDFGPVTVPEGHFFAMGDNRDNSLDSRFPSLSGGGIGMVPQDKLVGRASFIAFSTDGGASWGEPSTWFSAMRPSRIGDGL
ncbi:signal peptidase I [Qipengyuania atrilutea]|uniref:Signal peptidase I n=1 Tax=Qipengyuania atrilutea TaxID=2744473 RepID=A0A850H2K4_9SPHN|nr:signal peptidase I [Actirhodobacter atriluteus]NVD44138.1 signal peptidase I [Actirhodobacter atriluteus]